MRTLLAATLLFTSLAWAESKPLVVHEWGTFTSLQDETGRTIGGVNIDDEKLPEFVHRMGVKKGAVSSPSAVFDGGKSLYPGHPSVTMRLETPVIYFYPPDQTPMTLDVTATFNGGVLSEFFPQGATSLNGKPFDRRVESVKPTMRGGITWKNVIINSAKAPPATSEHVWLAPRNVPAAAPIQIGDEAEKYIFYRGVGHFDAPLTVKRKGNDALNIAATGDFKSRALWLADFRPDGTCAFREIAIGDASAAFTDADYTSDNVARLRALMKQSLVSDGLFEDEAEAMLETWKLSYFKSAGQRLFFMVPQAWTDEVLPLEISRPAQITRVMIGRIELVTPQQRQLVDRLTDKTLRHDDPVRAELTKKLGRFAGPLINDGYLQRTRTAAQVSAAK